MKPADETMSAAGHLTPSSRIALERVQAIVRRWGERASVRSAFVLACLAWSLPVLAPQAFAQSEASPLRQILSDQTTIIERFTPPPKPGTIDFTVPELRAKIPPEKGREISFTLRSLTVQGAVTVPTSELAKVWQDKLGKTITVADLYRIAEQIDAAYVSAGYFSLAVVPEQDFRSGQIVITLYESYFRQVIIKSDVPGIEKRLAPYINRVVAMRPIKIKELERTLLLMSDLAGLTIVGTAVKPDTPSAGGDLTLTVSFKRASASVDFDNLGSGRIGPLELAATVTLNDLFRLFETTEFVGVTVPNTPKELVLVTGSQDFPIGVDGLHAGYRFGYISSLPGGDLEPFNIRVASTFGNIYLSYPFLRTISQNLFARIDLNFKDNDVDADFVRETSDYNRWISTSLRYDLTFDRGSAVITGTFGQGIAALGANGSLDELVARPGVPLDYKFFRSSLDLTREVFADTTARLRVTGQYAPQALPAAVQMNLGGDPYGRAFDGMVAAGDSGVAAAFELSHTTKLRGPVLTNLGYFAFVDYGAVWNYDVSAPYIVETLGSAGFGVRGSFGDRFSAQVLVAFPWEDTAVLSEAGTRVYFKLGASF